MCFKSRLSAIACAGALIVGPAQAGGFGGGGHGAGGGPPPSALPGVGVHAYAPGQGPTGAASWNGGSWRGPTNAFGPFGGYYGGGGYGAGGAVAGGGGGANVLNYNYIDNRRRDGGFYGGGGVFYGDDGYSRRPCGDIVEDAQSARPKRAPDEGSGVVRASAHIIYLPDSDPPPRRGAARGVHHQESRENISE